MSELLAVGYALFAGGIIGFASGILLRDTQAQNKRMRDAMQPRDVCPMCGLLRPAIRFKLKDDPLADWHYTDMPRLVIK